MLWASTVSSRIEFNSAIYLSWYRSHTSRAETHKIVLYLSTPDTIHNHCLGHPHFHVTQIGNVHNFLLEVSISYFDGSQNSQKYLDYIYQFIGNDVAKDTHAQLSEEVSSMSTKRSCAQELLFPWSQGALLSWHVDVFSNLEGHQALQLRRFSVETSHISLMNPQPSSRGCGKY